MEPLMQPSETALKLLRCPVCEHGALRTGGAARDVSCSACPATFPCREGVVDLLADKYPKPTLAQRVMESETIARIYETRLWRRNPLVTLLLGISFERERELILGAAALQGTEKVLDLACGPGIYTRALARRLSQGVVVGLDLSLPMLSYASRRADAERLTNMILVRGTAMSLPFPDRQLAHVNCCGALHLFPDVPHVLAEIRRVLAPGGTFTVAAYRRRESRLSQRATGTRRALTGMDAFDSQELRKELQRIGFSSVECHYARAAWLVMSAR